MGAIGGIYSFDAAAPDRRTLARLSRLQVHLGPDGEQVVAAGPIALLYRPFRTQPAGAGEDRLHRSSAGDVLIWNGRLDNRDDVAAELAPPRRDLAAVELVHLALERWGLDALPRLLGDFSLAWWQPAIRRLMLATDIWALAPVFYHLDSAKLAWASRCRPLADALDLPLDVEDEYVASFLIRCRPSERSPLKRIKMLPPASALVLENGRLEVRRYWAPETRRDVRYRRDGEYEEQYRDLVQRAIACRLEASGTVFTELSGGFDSSSIACLGDRLLREGRASATGLRTVSYVYRRSPSSDESGYAAIVERALGREGLHIDDDEAPLLRPPAAADFRPDQPVGQLIYLARNQFLADRMAATGARVLLRGFGGDQVTWGDVGVTPFVIGDHLVSWRWWRAVRSAAQWSLVLKIPLHQTFWHGGLWPLMPRTIRKRTSSFALPVERWFHPDFVRRCDLRDHTLGPQDELDFPLPSQAQQYVSVREVAHQVGWEFTLERGCVECRFPFLDRRLVEFALATPMEKMVGPGQPRRMARQALRGLLPPEIQARRSKAGPDEAVYRTFARRSTQLKRFVDDPLVAEHGFVDREAFRSSFERACYGGKLVAPQLLRTFALEFWLRSLVRRHEANGFTHNPPSLGTEQPKEVQA